MEKARQQPSVRLDLAGQLIWRDGEKFSLRSKTWEVLRHLADRPGQVVTKQELLDAVWPDTAVEEKVVAISVSEIRQALDDDARNPRFIETVHGRGFRLLARLNARAVTRDAVGEMTGDIDIAGRSQELERIARAVTLSREGAGQLVSIAGDPGIGKSRLAREVMRRATEAGSQRLYGRCYEGAGTPVLWPWVEIINGYLGSRDSDEVRATVGEHGRDLAELVPRLRAILPEIETEPYADPEWGRARLFAAVAEVLSRTALETPLVLAIDDIQWADSSTLQLLRVVAQNAAADNLCLLVIQRTTDGRSQREIADFLGDLGHQLPLTDVVLGGLTTAEIDAMVRSLAGTDLAAPIIERLAETTEGNPFFVEGLVQHWIDLGLVVRGRGLASQLVGEDLPLAPSVLHSVGRTVDGLDKDVRQILRGAAVAGLEFDSLVVATATGKPMTDILSALEEAVRLGVLRELPEHPDHFSFRHALFREYLQSELSEARRRRLHIALGNAIEQVYANDPLPHVGQIAHHYVEGADARDQASARKAHAYAASAAGIAISAYAFQDGADWLEKALRVESLFDSDDPLGRCRMQLARGDVLLHGHRMEASKAQFAEAAIAARDLGAAPELALAVLGMTVWDLQLQRGKPEDIGWIEEALERIGDADTALRARLMSRLATVRTWLGEPIEQRLPLSDQALDLGRSCGNQYAHAHVLVDRLWTLWDPAFLDERSRIADECVEVSTAFGSKVLETFGLGWQMINQLGHGDIDGVDAILRENEHLAREIGQPGFIWGAALYRATRATMMGELDAAEARAQEAFNIGGEISPPLAASALALQTMAVRREQGRLAEMGWIVGMTTSAEHAVYLRWLEPTLQYESGEVEAARQSIDELASNGFADMPIHDDGLGGLTIVLLMAETSVAIADTATNEALYRRIEPFAHQWAVNSVLVNCFGSVARFAGRLATALELWDDAERHFDAAEASHHKAGATALLLRTQVDRAQMLHARGRRKDLAQARKLVEEAAPRADDLGLAEVVTRARQL